MKQAMFKGEQTIHSEFDRRIEKIRKAMAKDELDALIVAGSEYTGFEGAIRYLSDFVIVHRYAYILLPLVHSPEIIFPSEARFVGEHATARIEDQIFVDRPGELMKERCEAKGYRRVGVYGLDYIMTVRDYQVLAQGSYELVHWDDQFDLARATKSEMEIASVRESAQINEEGFWKLLDNFALGKSEAEILAPVEQYFVEQGCGRTTMDMVISGQHGNAHPEFKLASATRKVEKDDLLLYSLEIAGPGGHWVEFSRPISAGIKSDITLMAKDAYVEYFEIAKEVFKAGATIHKVHLAVSKPFSDRGFSLGHVTGHSIGMTMIEYPHIGEGIDIILEENMVLSMHPHVITKDHQACFFMQDTFRVGKECGETLSNVPVKIYDINN